MDTFTPEPDAVLPATVAEEGETGAVTVSAAEKASVTDTLAEILADRAVRAVYQPVMDLGSGAVVGYEALARGPAGSPLERPDLLFAAARASNRLAELDWACRGAAFMGALEAGLRPPLTLFVNVEAETAATAMPESLGGTYVRTLSELKVIFEVSEDALTTSPAELLEHVARVRELGWGVALDDVGADMRSLGLMPFLRPDVIKLDLRNFQDRSSSETAHVVNSVNAEAERTGATVLTEGIETHDQLTLARAMGASLGQGYLLGRPMDLPLRPERPEEEVRTFTRPSLFLHATPFELVQTNRPVRRGRKRLVLEITKQLEEEAATLGETAVVLSTFQRLSNFDEPARERYAALAKTVGFVGVLALGMDPEPTPGVRGAGLDESDPICEEWTVAVISPHFAGVFTARDLGDSGPDDDRRFDFILTYNRELAVETARSLMSRIGVEGATD